MATWRRQPKIDPSLTPEEREEFIKELRAKRRRRMRWLAIRSSIGMALLVVAVVALLYWLFTTVGGRNALLAQIVARLPADATLTWEKAEGPAKGPLILYGVKFEYKDTHFDAKRVMLDPTLRPFLGRTVRMDRVEISDANLNIPKSDKPFELPSWPDSLPQINPPLTVDLGTVDIKRLNVAQTNTHWATVRYATLGMKASRGRLHVEQMQADTDRGLFKLHGDYEPRNDYKMSLVGSAYIPNAAGEGPGRIGFTASGDLALMNIIVRGAAPKPINAHLSLIDKKNPRWTLVANTEGFDIGAITGNKQGVPLKLNVDIAGVKGNADIRRAHYEQGDFKINVLPSKVALNEKVLEAKPLVVEVFGGRAIVNGKGDFRDPQNGRINFAVNARNLSWGGTGGTAKVMADGDFGIAGTTGLWAAKGNARLARAGQKANVDFDATGNMKAATVRGLTARMPEGTLNATGKVGWDPKISWNLDTRLAGFDPSYFLPDWKGALHGNIKTIGGVRPDGGLNMSFDAPTLGGSLRGRPLSGRAHVEYRGAANIRQVDVWSGDVALNSGASRLIAKGTIGSTLDVDAQFLPVNLNDFLPSASGVLRGTLQLNGPRTTPNIVADLDGNGLKWGQYTASTLHAKGSLPWRGNNGVLFVEGTGLNVGLPLKTVRLNARGAFENLTFDGEGSGAFGNVALRGTALKNGNTWSGAMNTFRIDPPKGAAWTLNAPTRWVWDGVAGGLTNACLSSSAGGSLCATGNWPRSGFDFNGRNLPLSLALPYLPMRADGTPYDFHGNIDVTGNVRPVAGSWRGTAQIRSAAGGMKFKSGETKDTLFYNNLTMNGTFSPDGFDATFATRLNNQGDIRGNVKSGWSTFSPLSGNVLVDTNDLTLLELLSPDIVDPKGHLVGNIQLGGTLSAPRLGGNASLTGFSTEIPSLATALTNGDIRMTANADGTARITGSARMGEGTLNVSGTFGWSNLNSPLVMNVTGKNVLISDTRDLYAVADPNVQVKFQPGQPITVTGRVFIPEAKIDLERLDKGYSSSDDVVILDPADPKYQRNSALDLNLELALGDNVNLSGFGLTGVVDGSMRVRARPGREMTATGRLNIDGKYTIYGQRLDITRGRLTWSGNSVSNPSLDIRAEREVGDVTAGVDITGRASAPKASVWTNPATSQSEALAYLALGHSLSSASRNDIRQLNAASAALSAGGSLLASQLGARIGLDSAGVTDNRTLGGAVFGVGKYLSPRLYVSYGVSLLGTGQVLTLKYLVRKGIDVEVEQSNIETKASANWRWERD